MKALSDMNFDWGGQFAPKYDGYMMATGTVTPSASAAPAAPAAASSSSSSAGPSASAASQPASGSGAQPASPAGGPTSTTSPTSGAPDPNAPNLEVIRSSHETLQRLGGPEKVQAAVERYSKMESTVMDLGLKLGYTKESLEETFAEDPASIYNHIVQEANRVANDRRTADGNVPKEIKDLLNRELGPVKSVLQRQMAENGNRLTDNEFNSQLSSHSLFKDKSVPAEVRDDIYNRFVDYASADEKTQRAILQSGDTSGLKQHFDKAVADFYKAVNAHAAWTEQARPTTGSTSGNPASASARPAATNPFNLDDIIEGNDNATAAMASMRNFR